ncbi:MAG: Rpn family recombination-promoting nuclease/putative transposase [Bacilli bacterium]
MDNNQNIYPDDFIMSPKVDFAFKELMTNDLVRKGFLSAVLNIKDTSIKSTVMLNTNLKKVHEDEKQGILDVRLTMNDNTEINIEIQLATLSSWADRSLFYISKMYSEQVGINKKYSNLKKCISISILNFNLIKDTTDFYSSYHIREDKRHTIYTDKIEFHIIELLKLPTSSDGSTIYDWAKFIITEDREDFKMLAKKNIYLDEAYKQLDIISQDKQKRLEYTARQKALYDYNTMMEERFEDGIQQGIEQERIRLIQSLKQNGFSDDQIEKILNTKITLE